MKIRMDFVTNSSSSNFLLARKGKLTEEQKDAIIKFVEDTMLGEEILDPESTEEEIQEVFDEDDWYFDEDRQKDVRKALKKGMSIYMDNISFEMCENEYASLFEGLWHALSKTKDFVAIDDDLSY